MVETHIEGNYDYIVVGGGTAGCIVANQLSQRASDRVLLLEAGHADNWLWFHIPVGYLFAIGNPRADWLYRTEPEAFLMGRSLSYPRGKVLGGSSAINAMIAMRGQAADYDHWRAMGLPGWGWDDVLPVFRRLEDHFLGPSDLHGVGGGWRVEAPRVAWPILDAVREAAAELGIPAISDFNTGDNEGAAYFHVNQKRGLRWSSARGYLRPAKRRRNLRVETNVHVAKIMIENGRALGVCGYRDGALVSASASREVILCAGAIGSAQLLQLSGIGPKEWLDGIGVETVLHRPGVGCNLQDHLQIRTIFKISGARTLNEMYYSWPSRLLMGLDFAVRRRGPLTMAPSQLGIVTRSSSNSQRADVQFHIQPLSLDRFGEPLHRFPAITASVCNLRPLSRGTVRSASGDPRTPPLIAPNYLSAEADRAVAVDSLRLTRTLMMQSALRPYAPTEYLPGPSVADRDDELIRAAGELGTTIFHPVGTAAMGSKDEAMSVVDERLQVRGIDGLRVVDASVMPTIISGNTNTPTAMIALRGADMILGRC